MRQTKFFQNLSDETRLRTLLLFEGEDDLCVCELSQALELSQPKISRHLAIMREEGLLRARRQAQWVYYSINPDMEEWQKRIVSATIEGNKSDPVAKADKERLADMQSRPPRCKFA